MLIGQAELQLISNYQAVTRDEKSLIHASVALILRDTAGGTEVLMMQRAKHERDPWSGQMSFPGGKIEAADSSSKATAIREAHEEVGAELNDDNYVGRLDDLLGFKVGDTYSAHVRCHVFKPSKDIQLKANYEVADLVWLPLAFLNDAGNAFTLNHPISPTLGMPSVMIDDAKDQVLWGMSLRMLMNLYTLLDFPLAALNDAARAILNDMEGRHLSKENSDKITRSIKNTTLQKQT